MEGVGGYDPISLPTSHPPGRHGVTAVTVLRQFSVPVARFNRRRARYGTLSASWQCQLAGESKRSSENRGRFGPNDRDGGGGAGVWGVGGFRERVGHARGTPRRE